MICIEPLPQILGGRSFINDLRGESSQKFDFLIIFFFAKKVAMFYVQDMSEVLEQNYWKFISQFLYSHTPYVLYHLKAYFMYFHLNYSIF